MMFWRTIQVRSAAVSGYMKGEGYVVRAERMASIPSSCDIEVYSDDTYMVTIYLSSCSS